jgi:hypothetical protein
MINLCHEKKDPKKTLKKHLSRLFFRGLKSSPLIYTQNKIKVAIDLLQKEKKIVFLKIKITKNQH